MPNCECYGAGTCRVCKAERALNEAGRLREAAEAMAGALKAWTQWEARLILDDRAWRVDSGCRVPQDLFDEYVEKLQSARNAALAAWERARK